MARNDLSKLARDLKPYVVPWIQAAGLNGNGGGGASGGAGVTDHGALAGLSDNDHPQYLLRSGANGMLGDLDLNGNDITDVGLIDGFDINSFGGTLTSLETTVAQLSARTVLAGDGIDSDGVLFGAGSPTVAVDVSDFAGEGLEDDGSNNLRVDEDYDFAWTGDHTYTGILSSAPFDSADPIVGFRIQADGNAWFANLEATSLSIKTYVSDVALALQGSEVITKSKAIISRDFSTPTTTGTLYVYDLPGQPDTAVFETGDFVRLRYVNRATGLSVGDVWGTVSAYSDLADGEQSWTFTRTAGNAGQTIYEGMVALDYGASGDGYIELTSLGDDTPRISLRTWTSTPAVAGNHTTRAILGNLSGHTDDVYGALSGYGFFTESGYLTGRFGASDGNVFVDNNAVSILAGDDGPSTFDMASSITFTTDPSDPDTSNVAAFVQGDFWESGGVVTSSLYANTNYGATNGADRGLAEFGVWDFGDPFEFGYLRFTGDNGTVKGEIVVQNDDQSNGWLEIQADGKVEGDWIPWIDGAYDLGSATYAWRALYVDTLYAGTVSSIDTGHNHNNLYYTESEIDSLLANKSNTGHTHDGLVTSVALATALADYVDDAALATALADYDTSAEVDVKIADLSSASHSHNLADLAERNYSSLLNRGHVLADADGLGADHTVSGLTTGYVLRATGATTAKFMQPLYADLGSRTHNVVSEHSITADRYSVVGTPIAANTLAAWATASDGTAGNVLLRSDSNGDLILNDLTINDLTAEDAVFGGVLTLGDYWTIDSNGNFKSIDPSYNYADPEQGTLITPDGRIVALDIDARSGRFRAAVYEIDSTVVGPSSEIWTYAGGAMTESATTIDSSGDITVDIQDGRLGHYRQFQVGETIRLRGPAISTLTPSTGGDAFLPYWAWQMIPAYTDDFAAVADVYLTIDDWSDGGTYFSYTCTWAHGANNVLFPAGTPVIGYGAASDSAKLGAMRITSDANGPRLTAFEYGDDAWDEDSILVLGNLGVVGWLDSDERGIVTGTSVQDEDEFSGIVGSNKRMLIQNPDLIIKENGLIRLKTADDGLHLGLYNEESTSFYDITGTSRVTMTGDPDDPDATTGGWATLTTETQRRGRGNIEAGTGYTETAIKTTLEARSDVGEATVLLLASAAQSPAVGSTPGLDDFSRGTQAGEAAQITLRSGAISYIDLTAMYVEAAYQLTADIFVGRRLDVSELYIDDIPTSSTGLLPGRIWSDSGTLKVVS